MGSARGTCRVCGGVHKPGARCGESDLTPRLKVSKGAVARQAEKVVRAIPPTRATSQRRKALKADAPRPMRRRLTLEEFKAQEQARQKRQRKLQLEARQRADQRASREGKGKKSKGNVTIASALTRTCRECKQKKPLDHFPENRYRCYFCGGQIRAPAFERSAVGRQRWESAGSVRTLLVTELAFLGFVGRKPRNRP